MSSLCCAIATQRLTALCHAIAAQITAFLLSAMPMHPKQNLAAANRYGAPLFLRKSHQRFSLPFLCSTIRYGAVPCPRSASRRFSFALPVCASQCRCSAVLCHCTAVHLIAVAMRLSALFCLCSASLYLTTLCHCFALPCFAFSVRRDARPIEPQPCLRESGPSMPCRCAQSFTS